MSGHQPQRRSPGVFVSRQVPASVGADQGAHHPGGGAGDGELRVPMGPARHSASLRLYLLCLRLQEREAEFEESLAKGNAPVVSATVFKFPSLIVFFSSPLS